MSHKSCNTHRRMLVDKIVEDTDFGHLYIRTNARAVRYTFRPAQDGTPQVGLLVIVPTTYRLDDVLRAVGEMRSRLKSLIEKSQTPKPQPLGTGQDAFRKIDWQFSIHADSLTVTLEAGPAGSSFFLRHGDGQMKLICPQDCDFDAKGRQAWLEKVLIEGIRRHAKVSLVPQMRQLAQEHGIALREVKINNSRGHWGSCSRHKEGTLIKKEYFNINLSLYTLLLPEEVKRLVLLHELCHTLHMDHSPAFHRELDAWLGGRENELEIRLKHYTTSIYSFLS